MTIRSECPAPDSATMVNAVFRLQCAVVSWKLPVNKACACTSMPQRRNSAGLFYEEEEDQVQVAIISDHPFDLMPITLRRNRTQQCRAGQTRWIRFWMRFLDLTRAAAAAARASERESRPSLAETARFQAICLTNFDWDRICTPPYLLHRYASLRHLPSASRPFTATTDTLSVIHLSRLALLAPPRIHDQQ